MPGKPRRITRNPKVSGFAAPKRTPRALAQFEAHIALLQAATDQEREFAELMKTADLSGAQYNVLRILRGAGPDGLTCGEIGDRLIQHDPDVTRLHDKLEGRGLVERTRDASDRRVVRTRITPTGLVILAGLDGPVDALHEAQLGHMNEKQLDDLRALIELARARGRK